jgi:hypothetical protein
MTTWNGTVPTIAVGAEVLGADSDAFADAIAALSDAWTSYSPTWSASTPPAIGNGSINAKYLRVRHFVVYKFRIDMGSTTTYGSGAWTLTLPVTGADAYFSGSAICFDTSTTANKTAGAVLPSTSAVSFVGINGPLSATAPFAWASGDYLAGTIIFEGA